MSEGLLLAQYQMINTELMAFIDTVSHAVVTPHLFWCIEKKHCDVPPENFLPWHWKDIFKFSFVFAD